MLFSSNVFLFLFLPAVLIVYYICPKPCRNGALLLFSLFFYGWGEPKYLILMVSVIVLDYLCGIWIYHSRSRGREGKLPLAAGVTVNLLLLAFFKYGSFLTGGLLPKLPLPIGISFYIFQSMSYIIDLYRNQAEVQRSLLDFGTYVALFPQLIAGPIVRYRDIASQLRSRSENCRQFAQGIQIFLMGLSKKMLLANPMGRAWDMLRQENGTLAAWTGLLAYSMQIYFDFSGYSDMAIGLGKMFGFEFLENFNYPYISASITEFWRRWHISLSTWFREYVYIPLGGNRRGLKKQIRNMLVVWLLTGLWHGASWNFLLWGGYYAVLLILEKVFLLRVLKQIPVWISRAYAMLAVMLGWALFFFEDLAALGEFVKKLFTLRSSAACSSVILGFLPLLLIAVFASTPVFKKGWERLPEGKSSNCVRVGWCVIELLLCTAALASQSYNPFIYFRF